MEKIVSLGDKSKEMGVSRQTIYNMLKAKRLEADYIDNQGRHFWKALGKEGKMSCIDEITQSQIQQLERLGKVLKTISKELCRKQLKSLEEEEEEGEEEEEENEERNKRDR